jgi:hypothetical protein
MTNFTTHTLVKTILSLALLASISFSDLRAQIVVDEAPRGLYYNRTARVKKFKDMKDFRDVFHYDKFLLGRNRIMGNVSYNFQRVLIDDGARLRNEYRSALGFFTRIRFFEEFSFNSTFYWDFNKRAAARWIADYNYSIGRYNWRPYKWNYGYENYINHKYTDNLEQFLQKASEGYFFVSYNAFIGQNAINKIKLDSTTSIKFTPFARWAFRYRDEREVVHYEGKPTVGLSSRLTLFWNIYVEGAVYYYFDPTFRQLPWDPDYTYGFGYFDWRSFRLSLTYGNWAVNRFPWKKQVYENYGFLDGNFRVVANWIW